MTHIAPTPHRNLRPAGALLPMGPTARGMVWCDGRRVGFSGSARVG